jgi:MFS family permease
MEQEDKIMAGEIKNRGKTVTAAGTCINLALGILYTWSIFKVAIKESIEAGGQGAFNWDISLLNDPYAVCCLVFALGMIVAGKCQDMLGPKITAIIGGAFVGIGFILISQTTSYVNWIFGFGVLVGLGIAFGYSSATPPALKWYPSTMTGKIVGIVVAGFALASVYIAPLAKMLINNWGLNNTMLFFGIAFIVVLSLLSMLLVNPPEGYVPVGFTDRRDKTEVNLKARETFKEEDSTPTEMIKTSLFWRLWVLYFIGAGVGLMVIGSVAGMAKSSMGEAAFLAVVLLAIGNAAGRVVAGTMSDRIGRGKTLASIFMMQAVLMFIAIPAIGADMASALLLVILSTFIGFNYGANLSLFPSFTKDFWGINNFGVNYGIMFTAWGVGGFIMSKISQTLMANSDSFAIPFIVAGVLLTIGTLLSFTIKDEKEIARKEIEKQKMESETEHLAAA